MAKEKGVIKEVKEDSASKKPSVISEEMKEVNLVPVDDQGADKEDSVEVAGAGSCCEIS